MNDQAARFRLGVFVLGALILLAVLIMLFGGWSRFFHAYSRYTITFTNAAGVAPGTPVRRSGVRIGEVESVELDDATGLVRVGVKVEAEHPVRKNDQPTIVHGLLGGDTSIDFVPRAANGKAPDTSPVPPGTTLQGRPEGGNLAQQGADLLPATRETLQEAQKSFEKLNKSLPLVDDVLREYRALGQALRDVVPEFRRTNDEIRELTKSTRETLPELRRTNDEVQLTARNWGKVGERVDVFLQTNEQKLTRAVDQLNDALRRVNATFSDENQKNLSETLKNAREGSQRLDSITKNTDELIKEGRKTMTQLNSAATRADEVLNNLQQATRPIAERTGPIMRNLDESSQKLNQLLGDFSDFLRGFGRGDGTLQRLLTDPSLYNQLNDVACMITRSLPRVDRILGDLEIFADKLARHPEALGLGGVVRPGTGLKDAPSSSSSWKMPPH
jgi:phospholipid/cholesterol/gamma-HCH transport system substrate-binding protein